MPEGHVTAVLRNADSELAEKFERFLSKITDGVTKEKCSKILIEMGGYTFDSDIEAKIDDFIESLTDVDFARVISSNEYGYEAFWIIDENNLQKFSHDEEEESKRVVKAYEALHKGMGSVRKGAYSKDDIKEIKKETSEARARTYLDIVFFPAIEIDLTREEFSNGYEEPYHSVSKDGYTFAHWYPYSKGKIKPLEGLVSQILEKTDRSFFARTSRDGSYAQKILYCSDEGITTLFDTDGYSEDELRFVQKNRDESIGEIDWFFIDLRDIKKLLITSSLEEYIGERVATFRANKEQERRDLAKLLADHPDERVPLLQGTDLVLFYRGLEESNVDNLVKTLLIKGMTKDLVEPGLVSGGPNIILVTNGYKPVAEWLITNIPELREHKIVIENRDSDNCADPEEEKNDIIINMY